MSKAFLTLAVVWGLAIGTVHAQEQNNRNFDRPRSTWAIVLAAVACMSKPICDIAIEEIIKKDAGKNVFMLHGILTKNLSQKKAEEALDIVQSIIHNASGITALGILGAIANGVCLAGLTYFFYQNIVLDLIQYFKQSKQNKENNGTTSNV